MTAMKTDDLAVITGALVFMDGRPHVDLKPGEVVQIVEPVDSQGDVYVLGFESGHHQYIAMASLTPLDEIQADDTYGWGDLLDPDYVHDYVWEGVE